MFSWARLGPAALVTLVAVNAFAPGASAAPPSQAPEPPNVRVGLYVQRDNQASTATYQLAVRNDSPVPVDVDIVERLPAGATARTASSGGVPDGRRVVWHARLPSFNSYTVDSAIDLDASVSRLVTTACVVPRAGGRPYDCTSSVHGEEPPPPAAEPRWQQPAVMWAAIVAAGVALLAIVWIRERRYRRQAAKPPDMSTVEAASEPRLRKVLAIALGLMLIPAAVAGGALVLATRVLHDATVTKSTGWIGIRVDGKVGESLQEMMEFTVYGFDCAPTGTTNLCTATVAVRNPQDQPQQWYARMQRAILPDGSWVEADGVATAAANAGFDPFAQPVPKNSRMVVLVAFRTPAQPAISHVELRSGAFTRGVSVEAA